ncbi:hypothetical protein EVAR_93705_1 [Eumeta japonica]|uniref:Uncharacterized protein n=1 Tax=Eumeta variegata TaxID=151549 RepID=A0A4C1U2P4_EUMVA|nr:hypothetical protein EVAR_93705_1 [Eumeta japonica]
MFRQYRISAPLVSSTAREHFWFHHGGDEIPITERFFSENMSSAIDSMIWDRASTQEVGSEADSLGSLSIHVLVDHCDHSSQHPLFRILIGDRSGARSEQQKDKSNALGLECGLVRRAGVLLFRMKRTSIPIMLSKVLPAESTLPQSQRGLEGSTLNLHGNYLEAIAMGRDINRIKESMMSDEHYGTTVSIRFVIIRRNQAL